MRNNCYKYTNFKYVESFFRKNFYLKTNSFMLQKSKIYKKTQGDNPLSSYDKIRAIFVFTKIVEVYCVYFQLFFHQKKHQYTAGAR